MKNIKLMFVLAASLITSVAFANYNPANLYTGRLTFQQQTAVAKLVASNAHYFAHKIGYGIGMLKIMNGMKKIVKSNELPSCADLVNSAHSSITGIADKLAEVPAINPNATVQIPILDVGLKAVYLEGAVAALSDAMMPDLIAMNSYKVCTPASLRTMYYMTLVADFVNVTL